MPMTRTVIACIERGAQTPDLLVHVIGEAIGRRQRCAQEAEKRAENSRAVVASAAPPETAIAALSDDERTLLEARARAAVPAGVSEAMAERMLPGIMAGLAEGR